MQEDEDGKEKMEKRWKETEYRHDIKRKKDQAKADANVERYWHG